MLVSSRLICRRTPRSVLIFVGKMCCVVDNGDNASHQRCHVFLSVKIKEYSHCESWPHEASCRTDVGYLFISKVSLKRLWCKDYLKATLSPHRGTNWRYREKITTVLDLVTFKKQLGPAFPLVWPSFMGTGAFSSHRLSQGRLSFHSECNNLL